MIAAVTPAPSEAEKLREKLADMEELVCDAALMAGILADLMQLHCDRIPGERGNVCMSGEGHERILLAISEVHGRLDKLKDRFREAVETNDGGTL